MLVTGYKAGCIVLKWFLYRSQYLEERGTNFLKVPRFFIDSNHFSNHQTYGESYASFHNTAHIHSAPADS